MASKGKAKKTSRPKPPHSLTLVPQVHDHERVHVPNGEHVLTLEHSLELVKTVITATVRCCFKNHADMC
jgi:hypothetical protein